MRVGIIGLGWVGSSVAISTLLKGVARELWLDDARRELAEAEVMDFSHGASFFPRCEVRQASVEEMAQHCDAIVIVAGKGAMPGQSRLDALQITGAIARELGQRLRGARGVVVVVTNPVDVMTHILIDASGLPPSRVLGTGTMLDTARLRSMLARQVGVDERSVHAMVLGEHGDSEVVAWSSAAVGGLPLRAWPSWKTDDEPALALAVRRAAYEIIARKGATNHAIGLVTAELLQSILRDEGRVLTVSSLHASEATAALLGEAPVALSLPAIVGSAGVRQVLIPQLDETERAALRHSADVLRAAR